MASVAQCRSGVGVARLEVRLPIRVELQYRQSAMVHGGCGGGVVGQRAFRVRGGGIGLGGQKLSDSTEEKAQLA